MGNFAQDLNLGIRAQDWVIKNLSDRYPGIKAIEGQFDDYDLISDDKTTFEVKFDKGSKGTGNVGIEYLYKGHLSGISKTKADKWVHIYYFCDKVVCSIVDVRLLKSFLRANKDCFKRVAGGDDKQSMLILVKKADFINEFGYSQFK